MLLDELKGFTKDVQDTFTKVVNILLSSNYLCKDKKDNYKYYIFVINYKDYFTELFNLLGDELVVNRELGVVQLKNNFYQGNLKLKKEETFILLILRILYQEKLINTTMDNIVAVTIDDIHNKYQSFGFKRKIFKTELVSALRLFKKYNIIDNLGELDKSSTRLMIYPSIVMLIPISNVDECYAYIRQLDEGKEDQNEDLN